MDPWKFKIKNAVYTLKLNVSLLYSKQATSTLGHVFMNYVLAKDERIKGDEYVFMPPLGKGQIVIQGQFLSEV